MVRGPDADGRGAMPTALSLAAVGTSGQRIAHLANLSPVAFRAPVSGPLQVERRQQIRCDQSWFSFRSCRDRKKLTADSGIVFAWTFNLPGRRREDEGLAWRRAMTRISAFTGQQAVRLTGLSQRMLRYWEQTGVYSASYVDQRPRVPYRRIYSFRDVVSLRTLALLRKQHRVKLDDLRRAGTFLREAYPDLADPWAALRFGVLNGHVIFRNPETGQWLTATPSRQSVLSIDVAEIARATERKAATFTERMPEEIGKVVRHRYVLGNAWRLAGTRIPTSAVWHFHEDGADVEAIQRAYPDLTECDILAAIDHERRLRGLIAA